MFVTGVENTVHLLATPLSYRGEQLLSFTPSRKWRSWLSVETGTADGGDKFSLVAQSCPTLCDPMDCSAPGLPVYHQLLEFTKTHVHWVGDAIQPSHPLSTPSPLTFNFSQPQGLFKRVSSWPTFWSFSFNISPSHEYSGLISFRINWLDLLAVQGTLKSLLQHHSSKASILWHSLFFMVQVYLHWNSRLGSDWWLLVIAIPIDARLTWKYSRKVFAIRIILITREKTSVPSYFISNNTCRLQILELQLILHHFQSSPCPSTCSSLSCSPSSTLMQDSVMTLQVICWKCWSP